MDALQRVAHVVIDVIDVHLVLFHQHAGEGDFRTAVNEPLKVILVKKVRVKNFFVIVAVLAVQGHDAVKAQTVYHAGELQLVGGAAGGGKKEDALFSQSIKSGFYPRGIGADGAGNKRSVQIKKDGLYHDKFTFFGGF